MAISTDETTTDETTTDEATGGETPARSLDVTAAGLSFPASVTEELRAVLVAQVAAGPEAARVTTRAPFDGREIVELPQCSPEDVTAAAERARDAQRAWERRSVAERAQVFLRLHDLVLDARDELCDLIQLENGKSRRDAFLEVADIAITCRYYARTAPSALRPRTRRGMLPGLTEARELHHPKGLVTIISPWNYPLSLAAGDTIPALLAGNAVVQKPDNQTALTALYVLDLARRAGVPEDLWQVVLGRGSSIGDTLLDIADYVMFTGSTESGRRIAAGAGERLVGCSLELGGKNPMLVLDDADLERAVEGGVRACFSSSGQLCISVERLYVADRVYDEFLARFLEAVSEMTIGPGFDFDNVMGTLTSDEQLETVQRHVEDARAKGATVLTGGRHRPDLGPYFYEPTVLAGVTPDMECFAEETFGPVVSVYRVHGDDEVIEAANATRYGLNSSVWSRSASRGFDVASRIRSGTVNVNEAFAAAWGSIDAPMGGMGDSGLGRRHGVGGLLKYTEPQTVARQRLFNLAPPIDQLGDDALAAALTVGLRVLKRIGWR